MLNSPVIIQRGYCLEDEYKEMAKAGLEKLRFVGDEMTEGIWIYPLEPSNKPGIKFHFVFHNDPIQLMGAPRAIAGLVGIATSNGGSERGVATLKDCTDLFKKAGKAAIDYFHRNHKQK